MAAPPLPLSEELQGLSVDGTPGALARAQRELVRWSRQLATSILPRRTATTATTDSVWARVGQVTRVDARDSAVRVWLPPADAATAGLQLAVSVDGDSRVVIEAAAGSTVDGVAEVVARSWQTLESDGAGGWHLVDGCPSIPITERTVASNSAAGWDTVASWPISSLVTTAGRARKLDVELRVSDAAVAGARDIVTMHAVVHRDTGTAHTIVSCDSGACSTGSVSWAISLPESALTLSTRMSVTSTSVALEVQQDASYARTVEGSVLRGVVR